MAFDQLEGTRDRRRVIKAAIEEIQKQSAIIAREALKTTSGLDPRSTRAIQEEIDHIGISTTTIEAYGVDR